MRQAIVVAVARLWDPPGDQRDRAAVRPDSAI